MKNRNRRALWCLLSAMGFSVLAGGSVMAAEDGEIRDKITIPYEQEDAWDKVAMINDDVVSTGVNIRATANPDGEVVGYLYSGMAAWVIEKGDEWTEINSGDTTGFVKNDYLLYGRDVIGLADHYGYEGVATTWDEVKLFSAEDADSDVLDVLESGAYFILLQDEGHWLTVQVGTDGLGYVSSEDVSKVLILDTAVEKDEIYEGNDLIPMNRETEADTEETDAPETDAPQTETSAPETEWRQTETSAPETEWRQTETSAPETNPPQTETSAPETDPPQTETSNSGNGDSGGWYDADTDTYYDSDGNVISNGGSSATEMLAETTPETTAETLSDTTPETAAETAPETSETEETGSDSSEDGWYDVDTDTYYDGNGNVIASGYDMDTEA